MDDIIPVIADGAPPPGGHYSQAVRWGDLIFVSGQLPVSQGGGHQLAAAGFEEQARRAFENLFAVLRAAGAGAQDVLKVTVYIADMADWPLCNRIYAEFFGIFRPARAVVPTGPLHYGYTIEVDAIARKPVSGHRD